MRLPHAAWNQRGVQPLLLLVADAVAVTFYWIQCHCFLALASAEVMLGDCAVYQRVNYMVVNSAEGTERPELVTICISPEVLAFGI